MGKQRFRIGFDAKRLFNNFSGIGNYSRSLVKMLQQKFPEHEYFLYTPTIVENEATRYFLNNPAFQITTHQSPGEGGQHNQPSKPRRWGTTFPTGALWRATGILEDLKKDNIQLYHGLSHELPFGIHKTNIRSVVTIHDLIPLSIPSDFSAIDGFLFRTKTKYAVNTADRIICISQQTLMECGKFYPYLSHKMEVIYPVIDKGDFSKGNGLFKPNKTIPDPYLIFVGANQKRKNLKTVLEAMASLLMDMEVTLVITGKISDKLKSGYKKIAGNYGLKNHLIFTGYLPHKSFVNLLAHAKALIYPSLTEGFGMPLIEAAMAGTNIICSGNSVINEINHAGFLILDDERNVREMENKIRQVLIRPDRIKLSIDYSKFNPEILSKKLMNCYRQLLMQD